MNETQAQKTVLAVIIISGAVIVHDSLKKTGKGLPSGKTVVQMGMLAAVLAFGAATIPEIAGPFSLLVLLAIVLSRMPAAPRAESVKGGTLVGAIMGKGKA